MARITDWERVTRDDVLKAIKRFDEETPDYNASKSSFLIYNGKRYPAKHLRGMAYFEATGIMPSTSDYHGGDDTLIFFQKLGFETVNEFSGISSSSGSMTIIEQFRECLKDVELNTEFTSGQLRDMVVSRFNSNPTSVLPQDYCYDNRHKGSNKVCFFLNPSRDLYIYVGENYSLDTEIEKYIEYVVDKYGAKIVPEDAKPDIHNIDYEGQHRLRYKTGGGKGQFRIGIRPEYASKLSQAPDTTISYHYFSQEYYVNDLSLKTKALIENLIRVSLDLNPLPEGVKRNYHLFKGTSKFKSIEYLDEFGFTYWLIKNDSGTYKCNVDDVVYVFSTEKKTIYRTIISNVNIPGSEMQHAIIKHEDGSPYTSEDIMAQLRLDGENQGANLSEIGVELIAKAKHQNIRIHLDPEIDEEKDFIRQLESFFSRKELTPTDGYEPPVDKYNPGISSELWLDILDNPDVTSYENLQMLKMMLELGGECACSDLVSEYGNTVPYYRNMGSNYGYKVSKNYQIEIYQDEKGNWPFAVPFLGKKCNNGRYVWRLRTELKEALENMDLSVVEIANKHSDCIYDKNLILYGPPGTGKTYITAQYAVAICDGRSIDDVKADDYGSVIDRYNVLKNEGRICFTTFHQSYGYEEFIEGIKPVLDSETESTNDEVKYKIEPGIFKAFCDNATRPVLKKDLDIGIGNTPNIWKVSLEGTGDNPTRTECLKNGHIRIGWDDYGEAIDMDLITTGKAVLNSFINVMKKGDIILSCYTQSTIDAIGIVKGDYEWHPEYENYKRLREVDWIVKGIQEDITGINNGKVMTLSTVYKMSISLPDCIELIRKHIPSKDVSESKNYVFIIDEINRGNISKIFGELITLIEDTKRKGLQEEATITLPYSKKPFSVPNNVYILGTMNTADRSIALMDTALRRRFKFVEMQPDPDVLISEGCDKVIVNGTELNVVKMLEVINKRIEYLYDREHTIGHAFFLKLKGQNNDIKKLADIFEGNLIPLLQEYFYEDYGKIAMVLGDNGKEPDLQFVQKYEIKPNAVFNGDAGEIDLPEFSYRINPSAFNNIMAYKGISKDL